MKVELSQAQISLLIACMSEAVKSDYRIAQDQGTNSYTPEWLALRTKLETAYQPVPLTKFTRTLAKE